MTDDTAALLEFCAVSKRFGGTQAVDAVSFGVRPGEIVALLGENGAGKSTLIKLLAGIYPMDSGEIRFDGQPEAAWRSADRRSQPVAFIHQDLGLVEWMTVAENVALGMGYQRRFGQGWAQTWGLIDWRASREAARRVMARVGCNINPEQRVFSLSRAEKSLLAIGRALEVQARVLVLDEPSASLPRADVERLFAVLQQLRRQGMAMIYVSHRLDEVMALSDRCVVMRDGKRVATLATAETSESELVRLIVGKALDAAVPTSALASAPASALMQQPAANPVDSAGVAAPHPVAAAPAIARVPVLRLKAAASGNAGPVSFDVMPGEVLGLVGLRGAGQEAISRALFGREPLSAGQMMLQGRALVLRSPQDAIRAGIAYVAGERLEENLAGAMSVRENLFPNPALHGDTGLALDRRRREQAIAQQLIRQFDVNPPAPEAAVQQLSGGNQQKVVLARWFHLDKPLVVLEEPTAGVDVGAKRQIYGVLRERAAAGTALVVVSTDIEEIAAVCTRVLVFRQGLIAAELIGPQISVERLLGLSAGGALRPETSLENA